MKNVNKQNVKNEAVLGKQRGYTEIVELLDKNWTTNIVDKSLSCVKKLDAVFGNLSQKMNVVLVGGTNGKSLTINFATKLLQAEGLRVGSFVSPHILLYNERFSLNGETIASKVFADVANEVLNAAEAEGLTPNTYEILLMMALLYFNANDVDVVLIEATNHSVDSIFSPKIAAITRVTFDATSSSAGDVTEPYIKNLLEVVKKGTHVVSADQSKLNLQMMHDLVEARGGDWDMPIRKLAPLAYPFEQLHGRCAALAERIAYIYVNSFANKDAVVVAGTILTKQKGRRGRPTLEVKRQSELNPKKTVEQFWKDSQLQFQTRFQLLEKEKPTLLLDNANNLDAFKNLLLGIRLLHYQRPLKGLSLVISSNNNTSDMAEFLKLFRYFFKKTSGSIIFCPVKSIPGHVDTESWDIEKIINDTKSMKIKAKSCSNFKEAFEVACKSVDERHGLVVVTGSPAIIAEYWKHKGVKKF